MISLLQIPIAANQRIKHAERRLDALRELAALTLRIMPTVGGDAPEGASDRPNGRSPALPFARLSLGLRLTQVMAAKTEMHVAALRPPFRGASVG